MHRRHPWQHREGQAVDRVSLLVRHRVLQADQTALRWLSGCAPHRDMEVPGGGNRRHERLLRKDNAVAASAARETGA